MKTVVLCGGTGTPLREETDYHPTPLAAIGNRSVRWHIVNHYTHQVLAGFVLHLGYKDEMIKNYLYDFAQGCWKTWHTRGQILQGAVSYRENEVLRDVLEIPAGRQG